MNKIYRNSKIKGEAQNLRINKICLFWTCNQRNYELIRLTCVSHLFLVSLSCVVIISCYDQ